MFLEEIPHSRQLDALISQIYFGMKLYMFLVLLESCLQTRMTYTIAECAVNELLMMAKGTVENM